MAILAKPFGQGLHIKQILFLGRPAFFNSEDLNRAFSSFNYQFSNLQNKFGVSGDGGIYLAANIVTTSEWEDTVAFTINVQWATKTLGPAVPISQEAIGDIGFNGEDANPLTTIQWNGVTVTLPIQQEGSASAVGVSYANLNAKGTHILWVSADLATKTFADDNDLCGVSSDEYPTKVQSVDVEVYENMAFRLSSYENYQANKASFGTDFACPIALFVPTYSPKHGKYMMEVVKLYQSNSDDSDMDNFQPRFQQFDVLNDINTTLSGINLYDNDGESLISAFRRVGTLRHDRPSLLKSFMSYKRVSVAVSDDPIKSDYSILNLVTAEANVIQVTSGGSFSNTIRYVKGMKSHGTVVFLIMTVDGYLEHLGDEVEGGNKVNRDYFFPEYAPLWLVDYAKYAYGEYINIGGRTVYRLPYKKDDVYMLVYNHERMGNNAVYSGAWDCYPIVGGAHSENLRLAENVFRSQIQSNALYEASTNGVLLSRPNVVSGGGTSYFTANPVYWYYQGDIYVVPAGSFTIGAGNTCKVRPVTPATYVGIYPRAQFYDAGGASDADVFGVNAAGYPSISWPLELVAAS